MKNLNLPPLEKQKKIATVLTQAEKLKDLHHQVAEQYAVLQNIIESTNLGEQLGSTNKLIANQKSKAHGAADEMGELYKEMLEVLMKL